MHLIWLWTSQSEAVDSSSAHVWLGKEDLGAVVSLHVEASHVHSSPQCENFCWLKIIAKSGNKIVCIEAHCLTFELNRTHCDVELGIPLVEDLL